MHDSLGEAILWNEQFYSSSLGFITSCYIRESKGYFCDNNSKISLEIIGRVPTKILSLSQMSRRLMSA